MKLKIGDKVDVLDDALSGVIQSIKGEIITIETEDGFDLEFKPSELVKTKPATLRNNVFDSASIRQVLSEKTEKKRHSTTKIKAKERYEPMMEVDLHLHKLVDHERGMTNYDKLSIQLDTARHKLEFAIKKRIQKIVFIHGVGEGVLKMELETLFSRYDNVKYYEADYKKYGLGATEVYIMQNPNTNN
ncbi:Smr/MutS family protein [Olleya sp. HaHaR_3_96]|uniref:Smr/MutS family protein n=1 Tax=Olleya sp. HaHaR_3_96 TaxID=2745560 RepID=UPI001C4E7BFC|nr:Smr/MutS family protein [Olleya sp. HaHaR_3_96]QXP59141.1 DNA mismatch repair protein MutS [Olleya sp. HaHaR_3_96]